MTNAKLKLVAKRFLVTSCVLPRMHFWSRVGQSSSDLNQCIHAIDSALRNFGQLLTGTESLSDECWEQIQQPLRWGGLGLTNPLKTAEDIRKRATLECRKAIQSQKLSFDCASLDKMIVPILNSICPNQINGFLSTSEKENTIRSFQTGSQFLQATWKEKFQRVLHCRDEAPPVESWTHKAKIRSIGGTGALGFLNSLPNPKFSLSDQQMVMAAQIILGIVPNMGHRCSEQPPSLVQSQRIIDCPQTRGIRSWRHNQQRDLLASFARKLGYQVIVEPLLESLTTSEESFMGGKRGDLLINGNHLPNELLVDFVVTHPDSQSHVHKAANTRGIAARIAEQSKRTKYRTFTEKMRPGMEFIPASMECYGLVGQPTRRLINRLLDYAPALTVYDKSIERSKCIYKLSSTCWKFLCNMYLHMRHLHYLDQCHLHISNYTCNGIDQTVSSEYTQEIHLIESVTVS